MKRKPTALQPESRIVLIRQYRVMLDYDLAALYGIEARVLNQAVKRNLARFPADFMFQLTPVEAEELRRLESPAIAPGSPNSSPSVMSSSKHRGRAYRPYAFTEQGVPAPCSGKQSGNSRCLFRRTKT